MDKLSSFHPKIMSKPRTAGDGMESEDGMVEKARKPETPSTSTTKITPSLPRLVQVFPTNVIKTEKKSSHIHSKSPKFVPYEPYPGAVKPITPQTIIKGSKKSKNNMDINTLICQMSQMNTSLKEYKPRPKLLSTSEKSAPESEKPSEENIAMQKKIDDLIQENVSLKDQLKQQVQVNKELKTMLVASMGEDLEIQVQSLNEDKKHLANELLNSAQHLSTHQEQTEWLAGQCEVWRSKFLASSLMVEELAQCKKLLTDKTENLQQAIKQLLDERCRARDMMLCTYKNLYSLHEKWLENIAISEYVGGGVVRSIGNLNFNASLQSTNILDLSSVNLKLSENISSSIEKQDISHLNDLPSVTDGEKHAENSYCRGGRLVSIPSGDHLQGKCKTSDDAMVSSLVLETSLSSRQYNYNVMAMPLEVRKVNEEPVNALVHHAYSNSTTMVRPIASCVHCKGRVQLL